MKLSFRSEASLFDDADLKRLLDNALQVLRKITFRVQGTDEFFDYLTAYGCEIDGQGVRFPAAVIDKVMARCAEDKRRAVAAAQERGAEPAPAQGAISTYTHGQALHICDLETNQLRAATSEDLAQWCHAVEAIGITQRTHPTFIPTDVPIETADLHAFATIALNSQQLHRVSVYGAKALPFFTELCEIVLGSMDAVKKHAPFAAKAWVTSPFMLDRENIEIGMDARRLLGWPLTFGNMPVAGASAPVSVAGALVQNTAEALALSAMRLAIDDLPQHVVGCSAVTDMRQGFPRQIGPDLILHQVAGREMDDYLYRGHRATRPWLGCGAGAATVSAQSVCEKTVGLALSAATGARSFGVGCLAFSDVGSPVQLMIDCELAEFVAGMFRDVNVDDAHIGLANIIETAPTGGRYMESMHTAQFFREECWLPSLMAFQPFSVWGRDPSDMIANARVKARELYETAENQCPLSDEQKRQIRDLLKDADVSLGGKPAIGP